MARKEAEAKEQEIKRAKGEAAALTQQAEAARKEAEIKEQEIKRAKGEAAAKALEAEKAIKETRQRH